MSKHALQICVAFLLGWLASGCGETTCQRAERINSDLVIKASRGRCDYTSQPFETHACAQYVGGCSEDDLRRLEDTFDCLERLECQTYKEAQFVESYEGCIVPLNDLSADCRVANPAR